MSLIPILRVWIYDVHAAWGDAARNPIFPIAVVS
jgi:hypothetical protein